MTVVIPDWNADGLLPPIGADPVSFDRSPYPASLLQVVERFAATHARQAVLDGFLRYRAALHDCGLTIGRQWLDGSFVENIEALESRPPNDVDVVTFFVTPAGQTEEEIVGRNPDLFAHDAVKRNYHVDAYPIGVHGTLDDLLDQVTYWNSLWSHTRTWRWKGYVTVDLAPVDDVEALSMLAKMGELAKP